MNEIDVDSEVVEQLRAEPRLPAASRSRLLASMRAEARRVRVGLAEVGVHAGVAIGAVVWGFAAIFAG